MNKNRIVVIYDGKMPEDAGGYGVKNITDTKSLESFSFSTGTQVGIFPAFVDMIERVWLPIDSPISEMETKLDAAIQESKSIDRMKYEDKFFLLCKDILTTINDPRAQDAPIPKLGMDEIITLIEACEVVDFNISIKFSLKLLSLDAALKRYNILWWDNAMFHGSI